VEFLFKRSYGVKQKILIAGGGDTGGIAVRRILGRQNFQVFTTDKLTGNLSDGTEPDLLIIDSGEDSNNECFSFLQRKKTENSVPVILIGTEKSSLLPQKCAALQVDDILLKPYTLSAFLRSIEGAFFRRMAQQNEVQRREVEKEFLIGHEIQKSIMSEKSIRLEGKITVDAVWLPARILGGDFFGVFRTFEEQGKLIVCIADVCGKGLSAALVAVGAHSSLHSSAQFFTSPALLMNGLNHFLCSSSLMDDFFLTIFIACIDFKNGRLQYAVAGHNEMLFYSAAEKKFIELSSRFCPGGIIDEMEYENEPTMTFSAGDKIILYTDGITEALNVHGEQFSKIRLMESLNRHIHISGGRELAEAVSRDVQDHIGEARQSDDITILVVEALS
jgi:serine phosphatase RsbU (regulator of sigma subunit)